MRPQRRQWCFRFEREKDVAQIRHFLTSLSGSHFTMLCSTALFLASSALGPAAAFRPRHTSFGFRLSKAPSNVDFFAGCVGGPGRDARDGLKCRSTS